MPDPALSLHFVLLFILLVSSRAFYLGQDCAAPRGRARRGSGSRAVGPCLDVCILVVSMDGSLFRPIDHMAEFEFLHVV